MDDRYIPPELEDKYELVTVLKELEERQTLLLRGRDGALAILKRISGGFDPRVFEAVRRLDGDGAPRVLDMFESGGIMYLLREYVEGETLLDMYRRRGPLSARETASIGIKICGILERLHGLDTPLIHRDIKAENIMITPEGRCVLIDFGISRIFDKNGYRDTHILGTGFAAAPEQFGYAQTDPRSDIYSLGVLLHELSTGECALNRGKVPLGLRRVVNRCTRFDPSDRYRNAAELKRALRRVRNAGRRTAAAVSVAAVLALVLGAMWMPSPESPASGRYSSVYSFASPQIGAEVARQLGKDVDQVTYGDLELIRSLTLCGEEPFDSVYDVIIHGEEILVDWQFTESMAGGGIDTLEDIPMLPNLETLALCNQDITDLSPLAGTHITYLMLHGNHITDLSPLARCAELGELVISDNPVSDVTPLADCLQLWRLNVGATGLSSLQGLKSIPGLKYLDIIDCPLESLEGLEDLTALECLSARPVSGADLERIDKLTNLVSLYIWSGEDMEDLTALSDLESLEWLFFDISGLRSMEGIQRFKGLKNIDGRSLMPLDAGPIGELTALEVVNLSYMVSDDWSELEGLTNLSSVTCLESQEDAIRARLAGREVTITPAS